MLTPRWTRPSLGRSWLGLRRSVSSGVGLLLEVIPNTTPAGIIQTEEVSMVPSHSTQGSQIAENAA